MGERYLLLMQEEKLNNIIRKIIVPRYPWIDSFRWYKNYSNDNASNYWTLILRQSADLKVSDEEMNSKRLEIKREVNSLFNMLGLPEKEKFFTVLVQ